MHAYPDQNLLKVEQFYFNQELLPNQHKTSQTSPKLWLNSEAILVLQEITGVLNSAEAWQKPWRSKAKMQLNLGVLQAIIRAD